MAARNIIDIRPGEGRLAWHHWQLALKVLNECGAHAAGIAGAVHQAGHYNHQRQPLCNELLGDLVCGPLGAVVFGEVRPGIAVGFVNQLAVRVGIDCQRAGIHGFGNRQLARQFQYIARAVDVNRRARLLVAPANFIPARDMEHAIGALHRRAHAFLISHVAFGYGNAQPGYILGLFRVAHHRSYTVACLN
jgi:hypothetical protein